MTDFVSDRIFGYNHFFSLNNYEYDIFPPGEAVATAYQFLAPGKAVATAYPTLLTVSVSGSPPGLSYGGRHPECWQRTDVFLRVVRLSGSEFLTARGKVELRCSLCLDSSGTGAPGYMNINNLNKFQDIRWAAVRRRRGAWPG